MKTMRSETDVKLVPFDRVFLPAVRFWLLDPDTRDLVGTVRPPSDYQHERWYEELQADRSRHTAIIVDAQDGTPLGIVGLFDIQHVYRKAELWIYLGEPSRRRHGVGRKAVLELLAFAFETFGLHRVYIHVWGFNAGALAFFRNVGFVDEGVARDAVFKKGRFHDVNLLSMLSHELSAPRQKAATARPARPRPR